ncbi:MAG: transposase [Planctomycetota bacterium]
MSKKKPADQSVQRRSYTDEFKREAVQMLLDGHSAASICERLGISGTNLLYRWKQQLMDRAGPVGESLDERVKELQQEVKRLERERDVLKKALIIFGRQD